LPRRDDIHKILIIGAGPIVIGQACEFDYSGTQACKALRDEGYEIILVNSNPATIMTDPLVADRTFVEPILPDYVARIIEQERPDALLPTMGGQTALNTASELAEQGVLERYEVQMIGANPEAIRKAEDRERFKAAMEDIGLEVPKSGLARSLDEARAIAEEIGFPVIVRPSFTLGGTGGGTARDPASFEEIVKGGLDSSRIHTVLLEESVLGWKEFELEVMRDLKDNVVIICSIENLDPMGVHTGDSITVAPAQTLTDKEYEIMRDASIDIIREIGVETGGSNIQFALHPETGRMVVIEMNPRVSRSSALASKATGFPIAKMAAKLAVGCTLDEIPNDITRETPASFEPTIDYCVVKIPRFTFEKFHGADDTLGISMKSVGETMSIGRNFKEALQKGLRSLETGSAGLGCDGRDKSKEMLARWRKDRRGVEQEILEELERPHPDRIFAIRHALLCGIPIETIYEKSAIDPWFLWNIQDILDKEGELKRAARRAKRHGMPSDGPFPIALLREAKAWGFSDRQLATIAREDERQVREWRKRQGLVPVYKLVDTCAAEFEAYTPYYYSTYEEEEEARTDPEKRKIMILGGGPNRIGQGIEFDYCCVHASYALREEGIESIMVNSNPETVSTDYDTSDRLYFEPLTLEDVLHIVDRETPEGVIVQFGGQTPLNLAVPLQENGVNILGTSPDSIDRAEDRERFKALLEKLGLVQPDNGTATSFREAKKIATEIGYPVVVRPSYVLGGRAMEICHEEAELRDYIEKAVQASKDHPILIDKYLEDAVEIDVDAVSDGTDVVIGGIMEHVEEAGIHSGDSACAIPPYTLSAPVIQRIRENTRALALELGVIGLMNVQYAVKSDLIYVLEVNPRGSRTVPFVSKAIGLSLAKVATKVMVGRTLQEMGIEETPLPVHVSVKESVFPFARFPGVDAMLGPEMKSTGEVMGMNHVFGMAFAKSQLAAGQRLPRQGNVFISLKNKDKRPMIFIVKTLSDLGFHLYATDGTAHLLQMNGIPVERIRKVSEGHPNVVDLMRQGEVHLIINTPSSRSPRKDEVAIRANAVANGIPLITTVSGASAAVNAIELLLREEPRVKALQDYFPKRDVTG
jgi:carbamoyl-phosphate synthase large subunit